MVNGKMEWQFVEERLFELVRRDENTAYSVGHIYRQVQQAAGNHCAGWSRLRGCHGIFWWRHGAVTVFAGFSADNRTLVVLELAHGTRPQDFGLGAKKARKRFASL